MTDPRFAALDAWIARRLEHDAIPGLMLAITTRDETIYSAGHGYANQAAQTPVTTDHAFEIGSIGKSFTALLLLRMRERGQIDIHRPVSDYLPWFSVQSQYEPITIHHLLTHTAGIIGGSDMAADGRFEAWYLRKTETCAAPGEHFHYSNVGYKTLGYLIENVLGKNYGEAVTEEILTPLGMNASFCPITNGRRPTVATPHRRLYDDRPFRYSDPLMPDTWLETFTADGGIACTPRDFAIYARQLLNRAGDLVSDASFAELITNYYPRDNGMKDATYGYGFMTWKEDDRLLIGHSGGMVGHFSQLSIDPDAGIGVGGSVNGPASARPYVSAALAYTRALLAGEEPSLPEIHPHTHVENAETYAGEYASEFITCRLVTAGDGLALEFEDERVQLEARGDGSFFADHPALDRDLIVAEKVDDQVVAINHGQFWLGRVGIQHDAAPPAPAEWDAYIGWYRSHNPWSGLIRVFERRGKLYLQLGASAGDVDGGALSPLGDGRFQVGESPSAERISFDAPADGLSLRANLGGQYFYRTPESTVESMARAAR